MKISLALRSVQNKIPTGTLKSLMGIQYASSSRLYRYMDGALWFSEQEDIAVERCKLIFLKHFTDISQTTVRYDKAIK